MEHFREVQDGIFLLRSPFPPVWSGVTLVRGEELCLIDSGASADVVDGVIRPALASLGWGWETSTGSSTRTATATTSAVTPG